MININKKKVLDKWSPVLDKMGITESVRRDWMSEYAEYHNIHENIGYANLGNVNGMGAVAPTAMPGAIPGTTGTTGSGDYGQQLLPVAMKVAAQTIGLDLVSVKPTPGPVIDLMYVDYRYDDGALGNNPDLNPIVFKVDSTADNGAAIATLNSEIQAVLRIEGVKELKGGLNKRVFFNLAANASADVLKARATGSITDVTPDAEPVSKVGVIEFLGFSRIDGLPMFRAFRSNNASAAGSWRFNSAKNTFGETENVKEALALVATGTGTYLKDGKTLSFGAVAIAVNLVSALEDHIPGFVAGGSRDAMRREVEESTYPSIIAPNVTTKRVQVGTISVSSALKITEIEDIKAQTGIDIVQKLEGVLVNELSQTISKQIVDRLFSMGEMNRGTAPKLANGSTMFDFDVDAYFGNVVDPNTGAVTHTGSANAPGGETSMSAQRKLITKLQNASNYIATEGRVGPATFLVTNGTLASVLSAGASYTLQPSNASFSGEGQLYPAGKVAGITVYVDPNMQYSDHRILLGRKNNPDQPGVIFVPYLMAQSIQLISEATFAPRMLLRSRYAITEVGFFPQKQYMTLYVKDSQNILA